jgi:CspA family cold shock protein
MTVIVGLDDTEWMDPALVATGTFSLVQGHTILGAEEIMQGVVKAYDPATGDGVVMCDTDLRDYEIAFGALEGSIFRMLRQGQRVVFDLNSTGQATKLRLGSERDMETPGS